MNGTQARENYEAARALVKTGQHDAARLLKLMPSDRKLIEKYIAEAKAKEAA